MGKLWGSRFEGESDALADVFSFSIDYDYRLAKYDCLVGIAHAKMLAESKIISKDEAAQIVEGLSDIHAQIKEVQFQFDAKAEDVPAQYRGIGIRIEDDLLVTADGYENLTAAVPKAVAEVEAACQTGASEARAKGL